MGLHTGEAERSASSLVGLDINRAARIAAVAHGGQILASGRDPRPGRRRPCPPTSRLRDLGEHRLKDLLAPERLVRRSSATACRPTFPPLADARRPSEQPADPAHDVRRARRGAGRGGRPCSQTTRLLTLTGPGGTGKTRLSLQLAATVVRRLPGRRLLRPARADPGPDARRVADRELASASPRRPTRPIAESLGEWLRDRTLLLVLDNFEQVVGRPRRSSPDLLRAAPGLKVVVTSRAALRVSGEQEYPVAGPARAAGPEPADRARPVQRPGRERPIDVERRSASTPPSACSSSGRSPSGRASRSPTRTLRLSPRSAPASTACRWPSSSPRPAIKLLTPDAILARLEHQLDVLAAGFARPARAPADAARRDRLELRPARRRRPPAARSAVGLRRRLRPRRGRGDLRSVGRDRWRRARRADGPRRPEPGQGRGDGRRRAALPAARHDPRVRRRAARRRAARPTSIRGAPSRLVRGARPRRLAELSGADQRTWLDRLELDHDDIRAVLDRAVAAPDPPVAIGLAFSMWRFWQKRGHLAEARRRLEAMAAAPWSRDDPRLRARAHRGAWRHLLVAGRPRPR